MTVRITEAELARDTHAALARVQEGVEVIVEQEHRPVAVIRTPRGPGRKISDCIAVAKAYEEKLGYAPVPDPDFAPPAGRYDHLSRRGEWGFIAADGVP